MEDQELNSKSESARRHCGLKPGSKDAVDAGCRCPVLDNAHGKGYMGIDGIFVYNGNCPIHGENAPAMSTASCAGSATPKHLFR